MSETMRAGLLAILVTVWAAALAALLSGRVGPALPLIAVPLAGFAAAFLLGQDAGRAGDGPRVARWTVLAIAIGIGAGLWAMLDPNDYRAFHVFVGMMATICPFVTGLLAGAWTGAQGRP